MPRGVLTATCAAALAALAVATPSAVAAPGTVTDTDFTGGTSARHRGDRARQRCGSRSTAITEEFDGDDAARRHGRHDAVGHRRGRHGGRRMR